MTRLEAHELLNAVRAGMAQATEDTISDALRATGDLIPSGASVWPPMSSYLNRSVRVMRSKDQA